MPDRIYERLETREWTEEELRRLLEDAKLAWEDEAVRDAEKMLREMDGFAEMG